MDLALTYEELRRQRCELCAKGWNIDHSRVHYGYNGSPDGVFRMHTCTAPTPEAAYAELAREVAELRADKERRSAIDWALFNGFVAKFKLTEQAPIGPLFGAGWNGAIAEILKRIDTAIDAARKSAGER